MSQRKPSKRELQEQAAKGVVMGRIAVACKFDESGDPLKDAVTHGITWDLVPPTEKNTVYLVCPAGADMKQVARGVAKMLFRPSVTQLLEKATKQIEAAILSGKSTKKKQTETLGAKSNENDTEGSKSSITNESK